jgi:putative two-component system response regulator
VETEQKIVMLVDDNMANLTMGKNMLKDIYNVYPISSGEKLFTVMEKVRPDLILLDVDMPGMDGYETIKRLKAQVSYKDIPVIFLTAKNDSTRN